LIDKYLYAGIEDIVYAWTLEGTPVERLVGELHDYVLETYGPPF
jgi:hypothetical protein